MRKGNYIVSAWLQLMLLLLTLFPRELVHELFDCNDTHHCQAEVIAIDKIVSTEHHHCQLLQLDSPLPYTPACEHLLTNDDIVPATFEVLIIRIAEANVLNGTSRAPPVG